MAIRCSVLGHRYGEREFVEDRDRQGSEVVLTTREVKTCERCGETLVVSESKEVTTVEEISPAEPPAPEPEPEPAPAAIEPEVDESYETTAEADDGIIIEDEPVERERGEWPEVEQDEESPGDRTVEWPDVEVTAEPPTSGGEGPPPAWPSVEAEDEGYDAVVGEEEDDPSAEIIEAVQGSDGGGEKTASGFFRADPIERSTHPDPADLDTEYFCPQCNWSAPSLHASVRRGDVCPDCQRGYVAERDVD